jgi:hypothetical protein
MLRHGACHECAVIALWGMYKLWGPIDMLMPFKVQRGLRYAWALLSVCCYWSDKGGMFVGPRATRDDTTQA